MTWTRSLYPDNWEEIAKDIKDQTDWTCQGCGRPCRRPKESFQSHYDRIASHLQWAFDYWEPMGEDGELKPHKPTRFVLTVSHTDHRPENCEPSNLRALCAPCHCRYDTTPEARAIKKKLKADRIVQLTLLDVTS